MQAIAHHNKEVFEIDRSQWADARGDAIEHHAQHGQDHAKQLLGSDMISKESPTSQQHANRFAVAQHLQDHISTLCHVCCFGLRYEYGMHN